MEIFSCDYCKQDFSKIRSQRAHRLRCKENPNRKLERKTRSDKGKSKGKEQEKNIPCEVCGKLYGKSGIKYHIWKNHGEGINHDPNRNYSGNRVAWNKGLTKETSDSLSSASEKLKKRWENGEISYYFSPETRKKLSESAKARGLGGGYYPHPNKGERYKGIWFDSKWEVKLAKSLDENSILWERPSQGFVWSDEGRKYYPDFFLPEYQVFLEPKNSYLQKKDQMKIEEAQKRNNIRVIVLNESQLTWEIVREIILKEQ